MSFTISLLKLNHLTGRRYGYQVENLRRRSGIEMTSVLLDEPGIRPGTDDEAMLKSRLITYRITDLDKEKTLAKAGYDPAKYVLSGDNGSECIFWDKDLHDKLDAIERAYIKIGWEGHLPSTLEKAIKRHNRSVDNRSYPVLQELFKTKITIQQKDVVLKKSWITGLATTEIVGTNGHPHSRWYKDNLKVYSYYVFHPKTFLDHLDRYFGYEAVYRERLQTLFVPRFKENETCLYYTW